MREGIRKTHYIGLWSCEGLQKGTCKKKNSVFMKEAKNWDFAYLEGADLKNIDLTLMCDKYF